MEKLDLKGLKLIQLNILKQVADFCDKNGIVYFLCGGTLLGAIRHGGYIPWDDDIDIMLPRPDYEKLVANFQSPNLKLYHSDSTRNYYYPFAKISDDRTLLRETYSKQKIDIGVNIDLFPIDGFPEKKKETLNHLKHIGRYRSWLNWKIFTLSERLKWYKKLIFSVIPFFIPGKYLITKINSSAKKHEFLKSSKAGITVWGYGKREICPQIIFTKDTVVKFEGYAFKAPLNYHTYLEKVFGDYMKLPQKEKRVSHHKFRAWVRNGYRMQDIIDEY